MNLHLTASTCYIEIAGRNPIAQLDSVNVAELKNIPCILIASQSQRDNELVYYRDIVGFSGEVLFAENLEEARLMVLGGRGFMPIEGAVSRRSSVLPSAVWYCAGTVIRSSGIIALSGRLIIPATI